MKTIITLRTFSLNFSLVFIFFFFFEKGYAQCPPDDVILTSQAEVNAFAVNYPNCTEISSDLRIGLPFPEVSDITDLTPLNNLISVAGSLYIENNTVLTSVSGLNNISYIGYSLSIVDNPVLMSLSEFDNITSVVELRILNNSALISLSGLNNITYVGSLWISGNSSLTSLFGLESLTSIGTILSIMSNEALTTLSGLENLNSARVLSIGNNDNLISLSGLENLTFIERDLLIFSSVSLTSISALGNLNSIGEELWIFNNDALVSLTGLQNLTTLGETLEIENNDNLTDISALSSTNLETIGEGGGLHIVNNTALSVCNLPNFCEYLSNSSTTHPRTISGNAGDCLTEVAVVALCSPACPFVNLTFTTQEQIDSFIIQYPNCTQISGNVYISGSSISNLNGLSNITSIGLYLTIQNTSLQDLDGLSNLTTIGHTLEINNNSQLQNLNGLNSLTSIKSLWIQSNSQLQNLNGLINLTSIEGQIVISSNSQLTNISALQNINPANIGGTYGLYISSNPFLEVCNLPNFCIYLQGSGPRTISGNAGDCMSESAILMACSPSECPLGNVTLSSQAEVDAFAVDFPNCTEINGDLSFNFGDNITDLSPLNNIVAVSGNLFIGGNSQLGTLTGLSNLTYVGGTLTIGLNNLTSFAGLENLTTVGGNLNIQQNQTLTSLAGLDNLTSLGGFLWLWANPQLSSISELTNLTSIGGDLILTANNSLTSLFGLENVTSIGGYLLIQFNNALSDISAIQNIDPNTITGTGLRIMDNPNLEVCNLPNFCTYLQGPGQRTISGNAAECINETAVTSACSSSIELGCWSEAYSSIRNSFFIKNDGTLWGTGNNTDGQLGDGTNINKTTLTKLNNDNDWAKLSISKGSSNMHVIALKENGSLWAWGTSGAGLGNNTTEPSNIPILISADSWSEISLLFAHHLGIKSDGTLWAWGNIVYGELGDGTTENRLIPTQIGTDNNWWKVFAGGGDSYAIKINGTLWHWGAGSSQVPIQIGTESNWTTLSIGLDGNVIGLRSDGTLWNISISSSHSQIGTATDWVDISKGVMHSIAIKNNGTVWAWGQNTFGQLGNGTTTDNLTPIQVYSGTALKIATGGYHNNIINNFNNIFSWGLNNQGQFGNNTTTNTSIPTLLTTDACSACPTEDLIFNSQEEIDNFLLNYPDCTLLVGNLVISGSDIDNLEGLNGLTIIGGDLIIIDNSQLTNLDDLSNIVSIGGVQVDGRMMDSGGMIQIENNPLLNNISGLTNINPDTISEMKIINNPNLPICSLSNFCSYLSNSAETHPRTIVDNSDDCLNESALLVACSLLTINENEINKIEIYPNPVKEILHLNKEVKTLTVVDLLGKILIIKNNVNQLDVSGFQNGVYLLNIELENGFKETKKFVKQ